jgi:UDP-3-O-[3-hydroxymyristoyl] glucosamine N-acyltransferase
MNNLNQFNKEFKSEFEVQISELVSNESLATKFKKSFVNSSCSGFSTIDSKIKNSITFAKNERFLLKALKNENIKFILIPKDIECIKLDSEKLVEVEDPEMLFHRLRNRYFELKFSVVEMPNSYIGENSTIKNIDMIPKKGVYIGSNCEIGSAIIN